MPQGASVERQMPNGQAVRSHTGGRLHLTTLGAASLGCIAPEQRRAEVLGPGKPLALLTYLAFSPGRSASRDHLIDLLWADVEPEPARHALRQTLWFLRQRLGEDALVARDGAVALCATVEADRDAFLVAVEQLQLERAVELYRGDFLPAFAAPGGADFEHWADLERDRLRLLFIRAAEAVVRDWSARGRLRKAKDLAARVRDADPHNESAWRLLLEALLAANDRVGAELEARSLVHLLGEADRTPEPATRALLARVRETPEAPAREPGRRSLVADLIGREREFATIIAAWDSARTGPGRHIHITAAPGLGKTRLLDDMYARLRATGGRAVRVRANPGERQVPYALASELASELARLPGAAAVSPDAAGALVALNPSLSARYAQPADRASDLEALRRREIALGELLAAVAAEQPAALLIDDLHWGDGVSQQMLDRLLSRLGDQHVLAVTTARPSPEAGLSPTAAAGQLTLNPLSDSDVGGLVASLGALPAESWASELPCRLHRAAHGSPLLVLETLHLALERGWLVLADGCWACPDPAALGAELERGGALRRRIEELPGHEHTLLLLLSVAGTPVAASLVAAADGRSAAAVLADLGALEQRGLVTRDGTEWQPAHDEIAARALEAASPDDLRAAHAAIGRVLADAAGSEAGALYRAGRHLAAGGDRPQLETVFARWVAAARVRGDRRSLRSLALDMLGSSPGASRARGLVASLPMHLRLGLTTGRRVAAVLALALTGAGAAAWALLRPPPAPPDAVLVVLRPNGNDSVSAVSVPIWRAGWEDVAAIGVARRGKPYPVLAAAGRGGGLAPQAAPSPDGSSWAFSRLVPDSGAIKLFVVGPDGRPRQVTDSVRDDVIPSWSPDGRKLVFSTERWDENRKLDLAILDLGTGQVRQLTSGADGDAAPLWSPDGPRIAFRRTGPSGKNSLCWTTPDGHAPSCWPVDTPYESAAVLGWGDTDELIVMLERSQEASLVRINMDTRKTVTVHSARGSYAVSPDGRWAACLCAPPGRLERRWEVFPLDRPDLARPVLVEAADSAPATVIWAAPVRRPAPLDRLDVVAPADSIPLGAPYRLRARGIDTEGDTIAIPVLSWRSENTDVATIDASSGVVVPRRPGAVTIVASAGGWREAQREIVVRPPRYDVVLREDWSRGIAPEWVPFGEPLPAVVRGPGGRLAFWNQGDGWFWSGAYSRQELDASQGLGVDVELSTPVTGPRQQFVTVSFGWSGDSTALRRWDHQTGTIPAWKDQCDFAYPWGAGDNPSGRGELSFDGQRFPVAPAARAGQWYRVQLQLFPDGRCGVALEGTPLRIRGRVVPLDHQTRLLINGNSLGNRMLVGRVEVWTGVRSGVDWLALERRRGEFRE